MFVAHSFAGYLWTRQYAKQLYRHAANVSSNHRVVKYYILFGVLCSILPDFDLLYFYTVDNRQHPHHSYWTHIPLFWLLFSGFIYSLGRWVFKKNIGSYCVILLANTSLHLILDTIAGGIYWLYPFNDVYIKLIPITPRYNWWVWNFIFHWIFLMEISIILMAVYIFRKDQTNKWTILQTVKELDN